MITLDAYKPTHIEGARLKWVVEDLNTRITDVQIDGVWYQFEQDEKGISLGGTVTSRDVYFQHDQMPEDELAYFTLSLYEKEAQVVMVPGNSNIQAIRIEPPTLTQTDRAVK